MILLPTLKVQFPDVEMTQGPLYATLINNFAIAVDSFLGSTLVTASNVIGNKLVINAAATEANNDFKLILQRNPGAQTQDVTITFPYNNGTTGQILQLDAGGALAWVNASLVGFQDPMTSIGDIIIRNASNATTRLPLGSSGQVLTVFGGVPAWRNTVTQLSNLSDVQILSLHDADVLIYNNGTSKWENKALSGDISVTNAGVVTVTGARGNLTEGTSDVLTVSNGTSAVWGTGTTITVTKADTSHDGYISATDWNTFNNKLSNPMTTEGDLMYQHSGNATRLPIGTNGYVLTSNGTDPVWAAGAAGSLAGLSDVSITSLADANLLVYNSTASKWENVASSGDITNDHSGAWTIANGAITNAKVSNSAAIAYSKLNLTNSILNADIATGAAIAYSKLNLTGSLVTGDLAAGFTLPVGNGGTGATSFTANGVLYGNTTSAVQVTAQGAANSILVANAGAPSFSQTPVINNSVTVGVNGSVDGYVIFSNSNASGQHTSVKATQTTTAWTLNLPSGPGTNGYLLTTDGAGNTSWAQVSLTAGVTGILPIANGGTNSSTALNNNRIMISSSGKIVEQSALTANRALETDASGLPVVSATTSTELGYVSGVTSAIQTQIDGKANTALSNLTTTSINKDLIAASSDNYNLGDTVGGNFWLSLYSRYLYMPSISGTGLFTMSYPSGNNTSWHLIWPATAGSNGNALTTDGAGNLSWTTLTTSLAGLTDVTISSVADTQLLVYNSTASKWENVTSSGDVTNDHSGVWTIGAGKVTGSKIASDTITNTNINSAAAIAYSKLALSGSIQTSDLTSGFILPANKGGTGIANNAASTLTISGAFGTTLTVTAASSVTLPTAGPLATAGAWNSKPNFIANDAYGSYPQGNNTFEDGTTTFWATYNDGASATPVDGTGGSATGVTIGVGPSFNSSVQYPNAQEPLRGTKSFEFLKSSASQQGQGVSFHFAIDFASLGTPCEISFDYEPSARSDGTYQYTSGDLGVYIYDVANAALITTSAVNISATPGRFQATFTAASNSTEYRLIFHIQTTNIKIWGMKIDSIVVSPLYALAIQGGGTGLGTTPTDGELLIGKTSTNGYVLGTLTGTSNRVTVTNGSGSITLSGPQDIATTSTPTFGGMTLGVNNSSANTYLTLKQSGTYNTTLQAMKWADATNNVASIGAIYDSGTTKAHLRVTGLYNAGYKADTDITWDWGPTLVTSYVPLALNGSTSGAITITAADTTTSYTVKFPSAQGSANYFLQNDGSGNLSWAAGNAGTVTGTGTSGTITKWTGSSSIGNASFTDDGTYITIPAQTLDITPQGSSYNQGIRIHPAPDDYSLLVLGAVTGTTGTGAGQWTIARTPTSVTNNQLQIIYNATTLITVTTGGAITTVDTTASTTSATGSIVTSGGIGAAKNIVSGGQISTTLNGIGNSGSSKTIDWNSGNVQSITLTADCTFTFSNPLTGGTYTLLVAQDGTGSRHVTWPASVVWPNGTAPTLATAANHVDVVTFVYNNSLTAYYGQINTGLGIVVPGTSSGLVSSSGLPGITSSPANPASGYVGEVITQNTTTAVSITSGVKTQLDTTGITLTPGVWDITGVVYFNSDGGSHTVSIYETFYGTATGDNFTGRDLTQNTTVYSFGTGYAMTDAFIVPTPVVRYVVSSNTTYYMKVYSSYTTGTLQAKGTIRGTRVC